MSAKTTQQQLCERRAEDILNDVWARRWGFGNWGKRQMRFLALMLENDGKWDGTNWEGYTSSESRRIVQRLVSLHVIEQIETGGAPTYRIPPVYNVSLTDTIAVMMSVGAARDLMRETRYADTGIITVCVGSFEQTYSCYKTNSPSQYDDKGTIEISRDQDDRFILVTAGNEFFQIGRHASRGYSITPVVDHHLIDAFEQKLIKQLLTAEQDEAAR
jgi:hypothetical protein